ncbi:MAG: hypothetical protein NUV52_03090, partial [Candidatus Roizmanbacteria bacterium]|nr:hypothetical protein [Candidatus Roizmanbacteria bacterium]
RLQEQPRTVPPPSSTPLPRAMIEAVLKRVETTNGEETVTIRRSIPTQFSPQTQTRSVFDRGLNAGARLADRFLSPRSMVKNAAQSALQKGAQQVAQRAAVAAAENPATWPVIAVIVAVVVLGVIFFMLMDTNTMLAAAPYSQQTSTPGVIGTTTTSPETIIPTVGPGLPLPTNPPLSGDEPQSMDEVVTLASNLTDVSREALIAISKVEAGGAWGYTPEQFSLYNTYGWWQSPTLTAAQLRTGYGYDTCSGKAPADSAPQLRGLQITAGAGCANYPDGTISVVMGTMQFNIKTWEGYAGTVQTLLDLPREADRRVIAESFIGAGLFIKARVNKSKDALWTYEDFIKAAHDYYGRCIYGINGNYCRDVCNNYETATGRSIGCANIKQTATGK